MSPAMLTAGIRKTGYKNDQFVKSEFLGMTNGGEFCYKVEYIKDNDIRRTKVFVKYDSENDTAKVDY